MNYRVEVQRTVGAAPKAVAIAELDAGTLEYLADLVDFHQTPGASMSSEAPAGVDPGQLAVDLRGAQVHVLREQP